MKTFDFNVLKVNNVYYKENPKNFQFLVELINKSGTGFSKAILSTGKRHNVVYDSTLDRSMLLNWINDSLPLLAAPIYSIATKCYWILYGLTDFPICNNPKCINYKTSNGYIGKNVKLSIGYSRFCNRKCQNSHPDVQKKQQKTCMTHFGVKFSFQSDIVRSKSANSMLKTYGVTNPGQLKKNHEIQLTKSYENFILPNEYDEPLFTLDEYLQRNNAKQLLTFRCKKCGNIFQAMHIFGNHHRCEKCFPNNQISFSEKDIVTFLKTIYHDEIIENDTTIIKPKELDIFLPKLKLAFEYDGLYWHSELHHSDKNYHLNKTKLCEKQGIQLIHIFENEWILKPNIVMSRIKNLLGIYDKTIFARKCVVKIVNATISRYFQEENHIQGAINAKVNLGLYYDNDLISLMTFGKCRFDKIHEWEMLRFCNKIGYHIPGAAGKLLKYFERTYIPKSIVSYADRRWSQGNLYKSLGFNLIHESTPNYWYWKDINLESRVKYQKHMLKDKLEIFDENLTEVQNMLNNGYNRIFDCGNLVFEKSKY